VEQLAKVLTSDNDINHLRGADGMTLCGIPRAGQGAVDGVMSCPECAKIALNAVELVTKAEKREWRKL